tara:strand:- start:222442 stop:223980 length:1539 start_codon:yes stop_codon:yes gene_type:complete
MMKHLCCCILAAIISLSCFSQSRNFLNITKLDVRNSGVITKQRDVIGYYMFYSIGKLKKGQRNFALRVLNENLEDVNTITFQDTKTQNLQGALYNGRTILMRFYDARNDVVNYKFFDTNANQISEARRIVFFNSPGSLFAVPDHGFANYQTDYQNKNYHIEYFPNPEGENSATPWSYFFPANTDSVASATYLCTTENLLVNLVTVKKNWNTNKINFYLQGLNLETGHEEFFTGLKGNYQTQPLNAYYDIETDIINVLGLYYAPDEKVYKDNGIGLANIQISETGEIIDNKYLSWTHEFREFMDIDNEGRVSNEDKRAFMYFHEIFKQPDGSIMAVAEQYRKAVSGAGVALNVLAAAAGSYSSAGVTKMVIGDLIMFRFDPDFHVQSVDFIEKGKRDFLLPAGYDFSNIHLVSEYINAVGGFGFLYLSQLGVEKIPMVAYFDWKRSEASLQKNWNFSVSIFDGDQIKKDYVEFRPPGQNVIRRILPGKPGHILVYDYSKMNKSLDIHLEKINY